MANGLVIVLRKATASLFRQRGSLAVQQSIQESMVNALRRSRFVTARAAASVADESAKQLELIRFNETSPALSASTTFEAQFKAMATQRRIAEIPLFRDNPEFRRGFLSTTNDTALDMTDIVKRINLAVGEAEGRALASLRLKPSGNEFDIKAANILIVDSEQLQRTFIDSIATDFGGASRDIDLQRLITKMQRNTRQLKQRIEPIIADAAVTGFAVPTQLAQVADGQAITAGSKVRLVEALEGLRRQVNSAADVGASAAGVRDTDEFDEVIRVVSDIFPELRPLRFTQIRFPPEILLGVPVGLAATLEAKRRLASAAATEER